MKVLISPDSYKGSLSAPEAARAIKSGLENASDSFSCRLLPLADGGEGTVDCLVQAAAGEKIRATVNDPLGRPITAEYGLLREEDRLTAVIEMAAASGLPLLEKSEQDPMQTTTYGTGELIKDALQKGADKILLGIGGSATTDGGMGMARALGAKFFDQAGEELRGIGENLSELDSIELGGLSEAAAEVEIEVACDVDNPLYGERGAAYVYSPQKGASSEQVKQLDEGLKNFGKVIKSDLNKDVISTPGAGAAGGLGAGLQAFLDATLRSGIDMILNYFNYRELVTDFDLVISGEGSCDKQSLYGKVIGGVAERTSEAEIPLIVIAGNISLEDKEALHKNGVTSLHSLVNKPLSLEEAMNNTEELLCFTAEELGNLLLL